MSTQPLKIPQPLTGVEIKVGLSLRISNTVPGLSEKQNKELRDAVYKSLSNTCSLNEASFTKFSAKWVIWKHRQGYYWLVDYDLDDFGRSIKGAIGNMTTAQVIPGDAFHGSVDVMPPDKFRRETEQPIPAAQVVKPKTKPNELGIARSHRMQGSRKGNGL
jgi:hypothetical protein